ncbi:DgyrCDS10234 [Dimorphilus gyrociliatus]|uniref:long-chain-fatty-acid--CoA ligase n=1 Tax=Dimorphilus gyrociliatus TaxID=2664684 RepID=A0A7I8W0S2_9ANNE|nr:DgyrCDS10234 [Dimorphilus gyrociliatus]
MSRIPKVTNIIYMDGNKPLKGFTLPGNVKITPLSEVESIGSSPIQNFNKSEPKPHDIAVIMYTSGSTGVPKGVLISHYNILCAVAGLSERIFHLGEEDVYIAYLPLAHILELTCEISLIAYGASLGFGSPLTLTDKSPKIKSGSKGDLAALRPTLMAGVPLVLDRLFKLVWENVNGGGFAKRVLFKFLLSYKRRHYSSGSKTPLCDALIFKKLNSILGGRLRMIASGGAPLSAETQNFITLAFCFPLGQGYGLTETCGAASLCELSRDLSAGHVGPALRSCELRLRDWTEGGYTVLDKPFPRGEVLVGGGNVALGYFKNEEKTAEDFITLNGIRYFCTGDIGEIDGHGRLRIIDRKKDLVKLQAGEYISLGKVETLLKLSPVIDNICVYADSYKDFAVALIVPNHKALENLGQKLNKTFNNYTDLINDDDVLKSVRDEIGKQAKSSKLLRTETPQRITLVKEVWLPETGLVTAAMKLKRREIEKFYSADLERMYNE